MIGLFRLDGVAAARGDGLHPLLRALVVQERDLVARGVVVHPASAGCAGAPPSSAMPQDPASNVVPLMPRPAPDDLQPQRAAKLYP